MPKIDMVTEKFIGELLQQHTRRFIAALLADIESHLGYHSPEISKIVKDTANAAKRITYTRISSTEVESKHDG